MAMDSPGGAEQLKLMELARELIDEAMRASARESRQGTLDRLRAWLRGRFSSGGQASAQSLSEQVSHPGHEEGAPSFSAVGPARQARGGDGAPPAQAPRMSAREKLDRLSIPELQQVLHATLETISNNQNTELQKAYAKGTLVPLVEDLLERTGPRNIGSEWSRAGDPSSESTNGKALDDDEHTLVDFERPADEAPRRTGQPPAPPAPAVPPARDPRLDFHSTNPWAVRNPVSDPRALAGNPNTPRRGHPVNPGTGPRAATPRRTQSTPPRGRAR